jgi:hypothetical protein
MKLSAILLKNVINLNTYEVTDSWQSRVLGTSGEVVSLYLQLIDEDKKKIRYIPSSGTTLSVTFPNLDDTLELTLSATQPFAEDKSIWKVDLLATQIPASGNIIFSMVEAGNTKRFSLKNAMIVEYLNNGSC